MSMDPEIESFAPLLTQVNPAPSGDVIAAQNSGVELPSGLGVLVRAGASLERALLVSLLLLVVSLVLGGVLLAFPGRERSMVWEEFQSVQSVLVEVP
jgi:hypothetical protein